MIHLALSIVSLAVIVTAALMALGAVVGLLRGVHRLVKGAAREVSRPLHNMPTRLMTYAEARETYK